VNEPMKPFFAMLCEMYEQRIPFNKVLGFRIESLETDPVRVRFDMRHDLVGNYTRGVLHGGVISSVLDATGGISASLGMVRALKGKSLQEIETRLGRIGTIDLRVDYLRPGQGEFFIATSSIMRAGRRASVTRMEMHNDSGMLIAVGTGTYVVG
jgi:uncharacterized protein (TIGR00369 family)